MGRVPTAADPPPVPQLPDYALLKLIGSGSYGDVWLARGVTGVYRAIKIVWRNRFIDERPYIREFEGVTRFAAVSLREPSQLALLHAGRSDEEGFFYYVMELADDVVQGREIDPASYVPLTLKALHAARGRLSPAEVIALGVALARALASLHAAGLVHRDIKPSNIVLIGGVPKLADVGLVAAVSAGLTFVGTEGFVPPEGPGAPAADVYSLGKVLYELATGLDRHDWPRLPPDLANLPDRRALLELNEVLVRACEPDPRKRFVDASALLDELLLLQAGKSVRRLRAAERRTARALRVAAVLAFVSAVAGAGAWIEHERAADETAARRAAEADRDALRQRTVYAARLAQVQRAIEQEDFGRARRVLREAMPAAGEPDLRGIEWHMLSRLAQGDPSDVIRENGPAIDFTTASPDELLLAVHDEDRKVTLYDVATLKEVRVFEGVQRLAGFSGDGKWIVGTNVRSELHRWRTDDGTADPRPARGGATHRPLGVVGADRVVAWTYPVAADAAKGLGAQPPAVVVWDFAAQREVLRLHQGEAGEAPTWDYFRSAIDPAGKELVIVSGRGRASALQFRLTHVELSSRGASTHELLKEFLPSAVGVLPRPDGRNEWWVAEASSGRQLILSPPARKWEPAVAALPAGISLQARWPRGKDTALVRAHHAQLSMHDPAESDRPPAIARGHASLITTLTAPSNGMLFTASSAGDLRRWDVDRTRRRTVTRQCWNPRGTGGQTVFSADGKTLYAPLDGARVVALDVVTLEQNETIPGIRRLVGRHGANLWGVSSDGLALVCWNVEQRSFAPELGRSSTPIVNAAVASDGKRIAFTRSSGELCTAELDGTRTTQSVAGRHEYLWSLTFDPTSTLLWTIGNQQRLECRTIPLGQVVWSVQLPAMPTSLCSVPSNRTLVVALVNGDLQFHAQDRGVLLNRIHSGSSAIQSIGRTPDEGRLVGGGVEGDLHVVDPGTGLFLASVTTNPVGVIDHVAVSPTGRDIAVLGKTGLLSIASARAR